MILWGMKKLDLIGGERNNAIRRDNGYKFQSSAVNFENYDRAYARARAYA